jgi:protein required for attachment to host cells
MSKTKDLWVLVADSQCARLLHGTATQHGHVHLDEVGKVATTFTAGEHHRPVRSSQPGRSAPLPQHGEFENAHFAREVVPWLEKELEGRGISKCAVFAPSHLLGAIRKSVSAGTAGKLTEHDGELAQMSTGALAKHPRIVELLPK